MKIDSAPSNKPHTTEAEQKKVADTMPHVVIVGAGFGGLEAAKRLGNAPVQVTVIDRRNYHLFQPMLYQVATARLSIEDISSPIRSILKKQQNTSVILAEVDHNGRVKVQPDLTVPGYSNIFVIGDTAHAMQNGKLLPGVSPVTMQEGRYVAKAIADRVAGKAHRRPFRYFDKGTLATVGRSFAVADMGHFTSPAFWSG